MSDEPLPHQFSSIELSNEKRVSNDGSTVAKGVVVTYNLEYERYLELHQQFDLRKTKRLLRKCLFICLITTPTLIMPANFNYSGFAIAPYFKLFIPDVFIRQEQRWKCEGKEIEPCNLNLPRLLTITLTSSLGFSKTWA